MVVKLFINVYTFFISVTSKSCSKCHLSRAWRYCKHVSLKRHLLTACTVGKSGHFEHLRPVGQLSFHSSCLLNATLLHLATRSRITRQSIRRVHQRRWRSMSDALLWNMLPWNQNEDFLPRLLSADAFIFVEPMQNVYWTQICLPFFFFHFLFL